MTPLQRVVREAERWGVKVDIMPVVLDRAYEAPFNQGGITEAKDIVWHVDDSGPVDAAALVHDLSHVVVWRKTDLTPDNQDEDAILALDYYVCRKLKLPWGEWMKTYSPPVVGSANRPGLWADTPIVERRRLMALSRSWLEERGIMRNGKPTYGKTRREDLVSAGKVR